MTATRTPRQLTGAALRARCRSLREQLLRQQLATAEELSAVWPGGAENGYTKADAWVECYAQLVRFAGRLERMAKTETDHALLEATVRAASARQPVPVSLSIGERLVHPKSAWALSWLDALDAMVQPVARLATELVTAAEDSADLRGMPALAHGLALRTWAWILLTEDVGVPFPAEGAIEPPDYTAQLLPEDYVAIFVAHRQLHFEAIALMASALASDEDAGPERSRLNLSGFLSGYASEHGIAPSHLMRRWSFPEAMAAAVASAESHRVAKANAKAKSQDGAR